MTTWVGRWDTLMVPVALSSFSSCQKLLNYYNNRGNVEPPNCRVVAIIDKEFYADETYREEVQSVEYNEAGYPTTVHEILITYDGFIQSVSDNANAHLYDDQNRLIQEGSMTNTSPYRYRYVYAGSSPLPVLDTLYLNNDRGIFVEEFEYDAAGRMTRVLRRQIEQGANGKPEADVELRYFYDLRGNRQEHPDNPGYPGLILYNSKPSLYSLHRVWQIRYRDFSKNATATGETYNEEGLPTKFSDSTNTYFQPFLSADPGATVQYDCE